MFSRCCVAFIGVSFALIIVFYGHTLKKSDTEDNEELLMHFQQHNYDELRANYENYWTGLPISEGNPLYVDPLTDITKFLAATLSFKKNLILLSIQDYQNNSIFKPIMDKYVDLIGWNGVFDVISEVQPDMGKSVERPHWLGEQLYEASKIYPRHFGIELASRDILHKAPLHGLVWMHAQEVGVSDITKFKKLVEEELCYFKNEENFGNLYLGCT